MISEEMVQMMIDDINECPNEEGKREIKKIWIDYCESLFYIVHSKNGEHVPYHPLETLDEKMAMLKIINRLKKI